MNTTHIHIHNGDTNKASVIHWSEARKKFVMENPINFIKMIRELTNCGLKDSKDFSDSLLADINDLRADTDEIRRLIINELNCIHDHRDLQSWLHVIKQARLEKTYGHTN